MLALSSNTMAWVVGCGAGLYLGAILYGLLSPRPQRSPQDGMAVGCLMIAAMPGVVLAVLLWVGVALGKSGLVRVLFYVTVFPLGYVLIMGIAMAVMKWRERRNAWPTEPEEPSPPAEPQ